MNTPTKTPTRVGRFTIWVIVALVALVVIALALALGRDGTGAGKPPEPDQGALSTWTTPPGA